MPSVPGAAAEYLNATAAAIASLPVTALEELADDLMAAWRTRRLVFACGNGGSAASAAHLAEDIGKCTIPDGMPDFPRFRILSLADSAPCLLAWANDDGFERIFAEQLANLASPGDVLLAISTSGRSRNVLVAADWARRHGLVTWALTGCRESPLLELVDRALQVPSDDVGIIETAHLAATHWLVAELRARLCVAAGGGRPASAIAGGGRLDDSQGVDQHQAAASPRLGPSAEFAA